MAKKKHKSPNEDNINPTITENQIPRFPRPFGVTIKNLQIRKLEDPRKAHRSHQKEIIKHYLNNSLYNQYNNIMTIEELSTFLAIPVSRLIGKTYKEYGQSIGLSKGVEVQQQAAEELMGLLFKSILDDQAEIKNHTQMLKESQGNSYKPFISAEVTKSLKNHLDADKVLLEIAKTLSSNISTAIQVNQYFGQGAQDGEEKAMTTAEAIELLNQTNPTHATDEAKTHYLANKYSDTELPNINPMANGGGDEVKLGLSLAKIKEEQIEIDNHLARREDDGAIEDADVLLTELD